MKNAIKKAINKVMNKVDNIKNTFEKIIGKGEMIMKDAFERILGKVVRNINGVEPLVCNDRGASDLVTIIAIIVVVLAAAIIFRGVLSNIINSVGAKVINWINGN